MKKNRLGRQAYANIALISQLGISMIVPVFALLFIGIELQKRRGWYAVLPCLIMGIIVGCRNTYILAKKAAGRSEFQKEYEDDEKLVEKALNSWNDEKGKPKKRE